MQPDISVKSIIEWLKTKSPRGRYEFGRNEGCLLAQYLSDQGHTKIWVGGWTFMVDGKRHEIPTELQDIVGDRPFSFGAALKRAEAIQQR